MFLLLPPSTSPIPHPKKQNQKNSPIGLAKAQAPSPLLFPQLVRVSISPPSPPPASPPHPPIKKILEQHRGRTIFHNLTSLKGLFFDMELIQKIIFTWMVVRGAIPVRKFVRSIHWRLIHSDGHAGSSQWSERFNQWTKCNTSTSQELQNHLPRITSIHLSHCGLHC